MEEKSKQERCARTLYEVYDVDTKEALKRRADGNPARFKFRTAAALLIVSLTDRHNHNHSRALVTYGFPPEHLDIREVSS